MAGDGLYRAAGKILAQVCAGRGALRTLCYSGNQIQNKKALYALVAETGKHWPLLTRILDATDLLGQPPARRAKVDRFLALVLVQEFLFGTLKAGPDLQALIEGNKTRLRAELVKARIALKKAALPESLETDAEARQHRSVRINQCLVPEDNEEARNALAKHLPTGYSHDAHVPDLLLFPPGTDFSRNAAYLDNRLVLQDKASCFPPVVLQPPLGAHVIDTCAAPGNKTSQLAAQIGSSGRLWAFERDASRFQTLQTRMKGFLPPKDQRVECILGDFLASDPLDPRFAHVTHILCDPSCSGSGMPMSLERSLTNAHSGRDSDDRPRLEALASFQLAIVQHAMKFPAVRKIVYSTCSIHAEENELVVQELLRSCKGKFEIAAEAPLPDWPRRGLSDFPFAASLIRAHPQLDCMNGFFVALFERKQP